MIFTFKIIYIQGFNGEYIFYKYEFFLKKSLRIRNYSESVLKLDIMQSKGGKLL